MKTGLVSHRKRVYAFFDRSFGVELTLSMFVTPALLALWIVAAYYFYYTGRVSAPVTHGAVFLTIIYVFAHIFYKNFRIFSARKSIFIEDGRVIKTSNGSVNVFSCSGISGITGSLFPYFRRQMILKSPQKSFRVPVCIRGGHEMVEEVFENLERQGIFLEGFAKIRRLFYGESKKFAVLYELRARYFQGMLRIAMAIALLNSIAVMVYWERGLLTAMLWGYSNMLLHGAAYFTSELIYMKKSRREIDGANDVDNADKADDSFWRYYLMIGIFMVILTMAIGILITEPA